MAIFHGTSPRGERSSTEAVAEVQMVIAKRYVGSEIATTKGNVTSFVKAEKSEEWMARSPV